LSRYTSASKLLSRRLARLGTGNRGHSKDIVRSKSVEWFGSGTGQGRPTVQRSKVPFPDRPCDNSFESKFEQQVAGKSARERLAHATMHRNTLISGLSASSSFDDSVFTRPLRKADTQQQTMPDHGWCEPDLRLTINCVLLWRFRSPRQSEIVRRSNHRYQVFCFWEKQSVDSCVWSSPSGPIQCPGHVGCADEHLISLPPLPWPAHPARCGSTAGYTEPAVSCPYPPAQVGTKVNQYHPTLISPHRVPTRADATNRPTPWSRAITPKTAAEASPAQLDQYNQERSLLENDRNYLWTSPEVSLRSRSQAQRRITEMAIANLRVSVVVSESRMLG